MIRTGFLSHVREGISDKADINRMSATPKTVQIFLTNGDPRSIRVAEITTRIVQVIEVPRSLLQALQTKSRCQASQSPQDSSCH